MRPASVTLLAFVWPRSGLQRYATAAQCFKRPCQCCTDPEKMAHDPLSHGVTRTVSLSCQVSQWLKRHQCLRMRMQLQHRQPILACTWTSSRQASVDLRKSRFELSATEPQIYLRADRLRHTGLPSVKISAVTYDDACARKTLC